MPQYGWGSELNTVAYSRVFHQKFQMRQVIPSFPTFSVPL